jgi:hypothetical protein
VGSGVVQSDVIRGGRFELVDVVGIGDKVLARPMATRLRRRASPDSWRAGTEGEVMKRDTNRIA